MKKSKSFGKVYWYTNEAGKKVSSKNPVFDDVRKAAQWAERGSGFYNTRGKWVSTGKPPSPVEIKKAVSASVKLANKKIAKMKKNGLDTFSAELKKHSVFLDKQGFFQTDLKQKTLEEVTAMLQQVADFNSDTEDIEDYLSYLEDERQVYEDLIEEMSEEEREEKVKELRKLVDEAAQNIYDLTRDSDFLDHLYNTIDNDVERMDYIKEVASNWYDLSGSPVFEKWSSYDYSEFEDLRPKK